MPFRFLRPNPALTYPFPLFRFDQPAEFRRPSFSKFENLRGILWIRRLTYSLTLSPFLLRARTTFPRPPEFPNFPDKMIFFSRRVPFLKHYASAGSKGFTFSATPFPSTFWAKEWSPSFPFRDSNAGKPTPRHPRVGPLSNVLPGRTGRRPPSKAEIPWEPD